MAYKIVYGAEQRHPQVRAFRKSHFLLMCGGFFVCFLLFVHVFWPEGAAHLRSILLPMEETAACFQQLARSLQEGEAFSDAVYAFCREILNHAGIA